MASKIAYEKYILPIGALALVYFGGKKLFEVFGIIDDDNDRIKKETLLPGSPFDPTIWQQYGGTWPLTVVQATAYAKTLDSARGGLFNDNEAAVYGVFQALKSKAAVSFLANTFEIIYGVSLAYFLQDFLSDSEFAGIVSIVNALPTK